MDGHRHTFLWLSDAHYDPHYRTPKAFASSLYDAGCHSRGSASIGKYGCDAPASLVASALDHAKAVTKENPPTFVVISGDSIRHGVDQLFSGGDFAEGGEAHSQNATAAEDAVDAAAHAPWHEAAMDAAADIQHELLSMVQAAFPAAKIIVSVGNNDVVPDYYLELDDAPLGSNSDHLTPASAGMVGKIYTALSGVADSSAPEKAILTSEDAQTFLRGGYYARTLHDGALTILSLNTVLYSSNFSPMSENPDDPGWQFAWMKQMLSRCKEDGTQAIVVGHIPPAVGSFRHTQLWKEEYIHTFYEIVQEFDDVIVGQLFGHLHSDEFRVGLANPSDSAENTTMIPAVKTPILLAGSITPLHGNDPSIRLVKYGLGGDARYRLLDYDSYKFDIGTGNHWSKLYTFSKAYGVASDVIREQGLSSETYHLIIEAMEDTMGRESLILKQYRSFMLSGADGDEGKSSRGANVRCNARCRDEVICTVTSATAAGYENCLLEREPSWAQNGRTIFGLVGAAVFVAMLASFVVVRCRRRRKRDDYESTPSVGHIDRMDTDTGDQEMI